MVILAPRSVDVGFAPEMAAVGDGDRGGVVVEGAVVGKGVAEDLTAGAAGCVGEPGEVHRRGLVDFGGGLRRRCGLSGVASIVWVDADRLDDCSLELGLVGAEGWVPRQVGSVGGRERSRGQP